MASFAPTSLPNRSGDRHGTITSWESLFRGFGVQSLSRGVEVVRQGDPPESIYYVCSGLLKVVRHGTDVRTTVIGLRYPQALIGLEAALLGDGQYASVVTLETCALRPIPVHEFITMLDRTERLPHKALRACCNELIRQQARLAALAALSARERLCELVRAIANEMQRIGRCVNGTVELPLREWELAQLLAVTPQYLSRLMHEMEGHDLIRRGCHWSVCLPSTDPRSSGASEAVEKPSGI